MSRICIPLEGTSCAKALSAPPRFARCCVRGFIPGLILALTLQSLAFTTPLLGQASSTEPQRESLGSLNTVGEVYVNETRAPSELTIFPGDILRTGESGNAMLTTADRGAFQISHQSQVLFTGDRQYFAELKLGAITLKSSGGPAVAAVRAGNFVVVQTNRSAQTSATIESTADGSFFITCLAGSIGVIPMQETNGLFLQAGQSAKISPKNELASAETPAAASPKHAGSNHLWIYLGLAGAGIAGGTAAALAAGGSHNPMSPSSP